MASLSLQHINKTYPNGFQAVKDFNLEIEALYLLQCQNQLYGKKS